MKENLSVNAHMHLIQIMFSVQKHSKHTFIINEIWWCSSNKVKVWLKSTRRQRNMIYSIYVRPSICKSLCVLLFFFWHFFSSFASFSEWKSFSDIFSLFLALNTIHWQFCFLHYYLESMCFHLRSRTIAQWLWQIDIERW